MKRFNVRVITNTRKNGVSPEGDVLNVRVTAPAVDGKANKAVIAELARYLEVRKSAIAIIRGKKSRNKVIEVAE